MKSNCVTGVSLNRGDTVRVVVLIENNILKSKLPYQDSGKTFKVIGLPFVATYKNDGLFEAKYSSQFELTESLVRKEMNKSNYFIDNIDEIFLKMRNGEIKTTPFQSEAFLSYMFIDENVYQMLLKEKTAFSKSLIEYEHDYNDVFKEGSSLNYENNDLEFENTDKKKEFEQVMTESLKRSFYSSHTSPVVNEYFFAGHSLMTLCEEKNRDHFINAIFAFDILAMNDCDIKPFTTSNTEAGQKISIMKDIQKTSLRNYDPELQDFCSYDVDYIYTIKQNDFENITGLGAKELLNTEVLSTQYPEMFEVLPSYIKSFFIKQGEC